MVNRPFLRLMEMEIDRAEQFYREAAELPRSLHKDGHRIFGLMMETYHALLHAIRRHPADVFTRRIRVSRWKKLWLAARWSLLPVKPKDEIRRSECRNPTQIQMTNDENSNDSLHSPFAFVFVSNSDIRISVLIPCPLPSLSIDSSQPSVAIIGGGVAGLAAAVAAVEQGFHVELFEQAPAPGGRAGSYHDVQTDQLIDLSPHVAMGCCTNLLDFCRRTETADAFHRYATLHFFGPDGRRYDFAASRWLPAAVASHARAAAARLSHGPRARAIGRAMLRLARHREPDAADGPTMGSGSAARSNQKTPCGGSGPWCWKAPWATRSITFR